MQRTNVPTDAEAEVISAALWPSILDNIHHDERHRRRVRVGRIVISAIALVASGLLVGATVLAPVFNPGGGELYGANGKMIPATFALSCHTYSPLGEGGSSTDQYNSQSEINNVVSNFRAACESISRHLAVEDAIFTAASQQHATGLACGIVKVPGKSIGYWEHLSGPPRDLSIITAPAPQPGWPANWPANCGTTVTVTAAPIPTGPVAVCAIASNWAAVYLRGNQTPAEICAKAGQPIWGQ